MDGGVELSCVCGCAHDSGGNCGRSRQLLFLFVVVPFFSQVKALLSLGVAANSLSLSLCPCFCLALPLTPPHNAASFALAKDWDGRI